MGQELAQQVIAVMRTLRGEKHRLTLRELAIDEKYLFAGEKTLTEKQAELLMVREARILVVEREGSV